MPGPTITYVVDPCREGRLAENRKALADTTGGGEARRGKWSAGVKEIAVLAYTASAVIKT